MNSRMHRCFEIEDIVELIVNRCGVQTQRFGVYVPCKQRTTVAALAATSRIFYEPAMNALCRIITSDHLFYICGAQKSFTNGSTGLATEATTVGGALVELNTKSSKSIPSGWTFLLKHAHRVRWLDLSTGSGELSMSFALLLELSDYIRRATMHGTIPPFRHLRRLICDLFDSRYLLGCIPSLAGSLLEGFLLRYDLDTGNHARSLWSEQTVSLQTVLPNLCSTQPNLDVLICPPMTTSLSPKSVQSLHKLQMLSGPSVPFIAVMDFARLPFLDCLAINLTSSDHEAADISLQPCLDNAFPKLSRMVLKTESPTTLLQLFSIISLSRLPALRVLHLGCETHIPAPSANSTLEKIEALLSAVAHCSQLRRLVVDIRIAGAVPQVSRNLFRPLFRLENLEQVVLSSDIAIDDIHLAEIGEAWRHIKYLCIQGPEDIPPKRFTYADILTICGICPLLVGLSLHLEECIPNPTLSSLLQSGAVLPARNIQYLVLIPPAAPPPHTYPELARFFYLAFPSLHGIYSYRRVVSDDYTGLNEIAYIKDRLDQAPQHLDEDEHWVRIDDVVRKLQRGEAIDFAGLVPENDEHDEILPEIGLNLHLAGMGDAQW